MQILDLPRDPNGQISDLRKVLVNAVNSARHSKTKYKVLVQNLEAALDELHNYHVEPVVVVVDANDSTDPVVTLVTAPATKRATAKVDKDEIQSE